MSPTVLRVGPYRLFFFSNEGAEPPHIHCQDGRKIAKLWLNPVVVAYSKGFADHELNRVEAIVRDNEAALMEAWHEFFAN